jgi:tRNA dimethylallyltransferase
MKSKLITIIGPTASGKTDVGVRLAKKLNGAVVSADSRQLYEGMNIGTAKPKELWQGQAHDALRPDVINSIDHYGFNIRTPDNQAALYEWQDEAFKMIDEIINQNLTSLLVGGTMLYVDSVVKNYDIPNVEPNDNLRTELERQEVGILYDSLLKKDPDAKQFIESHHKQRIIRALEVIKATGKLFSEQRRVRPSKYDVKMIGLFSNWDDLREKVNLRIHEMLDDGLIEETIKLQKKYGAGLPLLKTMNYLQAGKVISGEMTKKEAIEEMIRVNLRYARRQMSWWRGRSEIRWLNPNEIKLNDFVKSLI